MTADLHDRDLTVEDIDRLPDSPTRNLLTVGVETIDKAPDSELDKVLPVALQFVERDEGPEVGTYVVVVNLDVPPGTVADTVTAVAHELHESPELRYALSTMAGAHRHLAAGVIYDGWELPEDLASDDGRDPGDVPGAVETRFVTGVMPDGTVFTVSQRKGQQHVARVSAPPDTDSEPRTRADRIARALVDLERECRYAYTRKTSEAEHASVGVVEALELATGEVDSEITRAELAEQPPSALRDLAASAMDIEAMLHAANGWGSDHAMVVRHKMQGGESAGDARDHDLWLVEGSAPITDQVAKMATDVEEPTSTWRHDEAEDPEEFTYRGVSVLYEALAEINVHATGATEVRPVRFMIGATPTNDVFLVQRLRGEEPVVALSPAPPDGGGTMIHMTGALLAIVLRLNAAFTTLDPATYPPATPTADLSELPPREPDSDDAPMFAVRVQWRRDEDRFGPVYPALPADHPFAQRGCVCSQRLGDGSPLQTFVMGAAGENATAAQLLDGEWHPAIAALLHQRCVFWMAVDFTTKVRLAQDKPRRQT